MSLTKPTKIPKAKPSKAAVAEQLLSNDVAVSEIKVIAPDASLPLCLTSHYGGIKTATSWKLKRRDVLDPYYAKFFIHSGDYTELNRIGIQLGVTWDEVLRGLVCQHLTSLDPYTGLREHLPVYSQA